MPLDILKPETKQTMCNINGPKKETESEALSKKIFMSLASGI